MTEPKILYFDLETSPMLAATFGLFKQNIGIGQIVEHGRILCYTATWGTGQRILFDSEYHSSRRAMLQGVRDLLDEADVVVGYNSNSFDVKWLNAELMVEGIELPSPYQKVDLYRVNKANFYFASGKLDYLSQRLLEDSKVTHTGMKMWMDICWGDDAAKAKAWRLMKRYAIQDTRLLPKLYEALRPFITTVNYGLYSPGEIICTHCGSGNIQKRGTRHTTAGVFQRYQCNDCRSYSFDPKRLDTAGLRPMGQ